MKRAAGVLLAAIFAGLLASALPAAAANGGFATEYGTTLPPVGFIKFCGNYPAECDHTVKAAHRIGFNGENWSKLIDINTYVNQRITPVSDQQLYGEPEVWTYPIDAGDCEDYLLLKKRYLEASGFAPDSLLITVVLDERGDGHAVLTVVTDKGDYVLDNRRNDILRWTDTGYRFVKRQSALDARSWVALEKKGLISGQVTSASRK